MSYSLVDEWSASVSLPAATAPAAAAAVGELCACKSGMLFASCHGPGGAKHNKTTNRRKVTSAAPRPQAPPSPTRQPDKAPEVYAFAFPIVMAVAVPIVAAEPLQPLHVSQPLQPQAEVLVSNGSWAAAKSATCGVDQQEEVAADEQTEDAHTNTHTHIHTQDEDPVVVLSSDDGAGEASEDESDEEEEEGEEEAEDSRNRDFCEDCGNPGELLCW